MKKYTKISPLGPRKGLGTFDCIFGPNYTTLKEAEKANDFVVIDFVKDENEVVYFQAYHQQHKEDKLYYRLDIQHFPFGIDMLDDAAAVNLAGKLIQKYEK